jgi:hypothetical protein
MQMIKMSSLAVTTSRGGGVFAAFAATLALSATLIDARSDNLVNKNFRVNARAAQVCQGPN